jgi:organic hydroperoxide reductase OsmC/OhrA
MSKHHRYEIELRWLGNQGAGTANYRAYGRDHELRCGNKPAIAGSSDPSFRGDRDRWNPEDLLIASLSACHQLWYLHLCAATGVVVVAYEDRAEGLMLEESTGEGQFVRVTLRPRVTISAASDPAAALALHHAASEKCFVARSMNFPVEHQPIIELERAEGRAETPKND